MPFCSAGSESFDDAPGRWCPVGCAVRSSHLSQSARKMGHLSFMYCRRSAEILRWESLALPRTPLPQDDGVGGPRLRRLKAPPISVTVAASLKRCPDTNRGFVGRL